MQFLGNLGIDIKLLIAQIVNFGILLWLLAKFLYKPIIKRIEKDEIKLKQAQVLMDELEQQKKIFEQQRKQEIAESKKKAKDIIKKAENITREIKEGALEKTNKEVEMLIEQSKSKINSLKPEIKKEVFEIIRTEVSDSFYTSFLSALPLSSQKEFQKVFWTGFIDRVKTLEKFHSGIKHGTENQDKLKETLTKKIGPIVLEYTYDLTAEQEKEIEKIISEKTGLKPHIIKKQNKELVNGFRFEFAGMIIESNLFSILQDALHFKEHEK